MTEQELAAIEAKHPLVDRWGMPWGSAIPWSVATEMDADIGRLTAEVRVLQRALWLACDELEIRGGLPSADKEVPLWIKQARAALGDA